MKAFLSLMFCMALMTIGSIPGQSQDVKFNPGETYRSLPTYKILASDTVNTNTEKSKIWLIDQNKAYTYIVNVAATRTAANKAHVFTLYGSINGVNYYSITTVAWKATTADTVVVFNSGTTAVNWRFFKVALKANTSGARATLGSQYVKIGL
jgi:hypothetical protein